MELSPVAVPSEWPSGKIDEAGVWGDKEWVLLVDSGAI